jgi:beta-mannosidase
VTAVPVLEAGWIVASSSPGAIDSPAALHAADLEWRPAIVPGTAAQALAATGEWDFDRPRDFDATDWWYRGSFTHDEPDCRGDHHLIFDGLATLAEIWLNGALVARTDSMFRRYDIDVSGALQSHNDLVIVFRSLRTALAARRPRPRWKTKLVGQQNLRWFRTTLLGRIPGWSPPVAPVGPYRAVRLACRTAGDVMSCDVRAGLDGRVGVLDLDVVVANPSNADVVGEVSILDWHGSATIRSDADGTHLLVGARLDSVKPWWPHTHGEPVLYPCTLRYTVGERAFEHDCGRIGFRRVEARRDDDGFAIEVNGTPVFCRGACWTTSDIVSLAAPDAELARDLTVVRDAGANMIRIGGTMTYERDEFYALCDELGLLVWQDFMFANMDYPVADADFRASVDAEIGEQVRRLRRHPSVVVYCGNSEVEQQAAMLGVRRSDWSNDLFQTGIPALISDVPYVPSTPSGGHLPFHVGQGVAHYYGVGAYLRPIEDVRRANVRFTPECLAFANVPEHDLVEKVAGGGVAVTHDPRWKQRTPRDTGAGWDFEDVRDHYTGAIFSVDPVRVRSEDPARYLDIARVTTGEVMARVFSEWRSPASACGGGLVWFLKDLWPGAGWGVLDSRGVPKACFHHLRRVWQSRAILITDEGLDGLHAHVVNDLDEPLSATVTLTLIRAGAVVVASGSASCDVGPRQSATFSADRLLDGFHDVAYAYRFGPPAHDVAAFVLEDASRVFRREAFWVRDAADAARHPAGAVIAEARPAGGSSYEIAITSERFLFAAHVDAPGFLLDDNSFCLMPGRTKTVRAQPFDGGSGAPFRAFVEALNLDGSVAIEVRAAHGVHTS